VQFPTPSDDAYRRILRLRAVRVFLPDPLEPSDAEAILEAGRWTGSSKNTQRWGFVAVAGRDALDRLATAGHFTGPLKGAALAVALVRLPEGSDFDIGRAAQNMMLAAAARGIASCPVTLHDEDRAREVLGVPADHGCRWAIAFGKPDADALPEQFAATRSRGFSGRRPLSEVAHRGTFGTPW
jgi:nitroreductase